MKNNWGNLTATEIGKKLHRCWMDMKRRCYNEKSSNYKHYGARGIYVCEEWKHNFIAFYNWAIYNGFNLNTYGKTSGSYSLDRIDNNGNYEPSNCKFSNKREQNINKKSSTPNSSGYIGICKHSCSDRWYGRVRTPDGKIKYTGMSKDILTAVKMRNEYILKNELENRLNPIGG